MRRCVCYALLIAAMFGVAWLASKIAGVEVTRAENVLRERDQ